MIRKTYKERNYVKWARDIFDFCTFRIVRLPVAVILFIIGMLLISVNAFGEALVNIWGVFVEEFDKTMYDAWNWEKLDEIKRS